MERREFLGNVVSTTLSASLSNVATSISLTDGSTFPTGSSNNFVIVIDRGLVTEEKILIASRSANTLTVSSRGYDGIAAVAHSNSATVDHILDATSIQDMNTTTYDTQVLLWVGI
jgi:hypothetical protein